MFELLAAAVTAALLSSPVAAAVDHPASCAPDRSARIVSAVPAEVPALARAEHLTGTSVIRVDLSETGAVVGAYVRVSSGSGILDRAAIQTAKSMTYAPATRSCTAAAGSYAVEVEFAD